MKIEPPFNPHSYRLNIENQHLSSGQLAQQVVAFAQAGDAQNLQTILADTNFYTLFLTCGGEAVIAAAENERTECLQLLLDHGPILHLDREKALFRAVENGNSDCLKLLLANNVFIDEDTLGEAFFIATDKCDLECVKVFLERHQDISYHGKSASVQSAANKGFAIGIELLLNKCPSIDEEFFADAVLAAAHNLDHYCLTALFKESQTDFSSEDYLEALRLCSENLQCLEILQLNAPYAVPNQT